MIRNISRRFRPAKLTERFTAGDRKNEKVSGTETEDEPNRVRRTSVSLSSSQLDVDRFREALREETTRFQDQSLSIVEG